MFMSFWERTLADVPMTAKELGMPEKSVYDFLSRHPEIKVRLGQRRVRVNVKKLRALIEQGGTK
jgi:hypothetical protein